MTPLELDDIQFFLWSRPRALAGRYEFLTFTDRRRAQLWLSGLLDKIQSAQALTNATEIDSRWVTVGFTWNGLRALGVDEASLETFPEAFKQGMAARAQVNGDTGENAPEHWVGGLASQDLHAIAILFARDAAERDRCVQEHARYLEECGGVVELSSLDLEAIPPYTYAKEHFGYRDRLSQPEIEGSGVTPTPGSGAPLKPGEFFLGYEDEMGVIPPLPQPDILSRNGSYVAYRRLEEHVGAFRDFLKANGKTPEEQELVAAKLMGRWRSGAPLVLAPTKDDPELANDPQRVNNFNYATQDPHGYAAPVGCHIRRVNMRDTTVNMNRRRIIRRGGTYGPPLPEGVPDDGAERGIAAFIGCADLARQFEFIQNVWVNDKEFRELGNEHDPICGTQDGSMDFTMPRRPIKRVMKGIPAFCTVRGGAYFFLPGLRALRYLAAQPAVVAAGAAT